MRSFLAIPLPEQLRRDAFASRDVLAKHGDGWRFVREDGLHLTLRFLGEVDPKRCDELDDAFREAAYGTGPIALRLTGAGVFPATGRPRVLWLGIVDETLACSLRVLAERIEGAARALGFPGDDRPFAAHVTLARARGEAGVVRPPIERIGDFGAFVAEQLVLYRSEPACSGSHYHRVASYPFRAAKAP